MKKYGKCCEVMVLALERGQNGRPGLYMGTVINFKTGKTTDAIAIEWRRAKKSDDGKYGQSSPFARTTYSLIAFCPFCGAKGCVPAEEKPKPRQPRPAEDVNDLQASPSNVGWGRP